VNLVATLTLLFVIGYSSQRSGVCMVRAVQEVMARRRAHRIAGFLLAAACAMLVMALADLVGAQPFAMLRGAPPDALAVAGGIIFGLGTRLSGHCAMGTLAALTAGELPRIATVAAMFAAALLIGPSMSHAALMVPDRAAVASPLSGNIAFALALAILVAALAGGYLYRRLRWRSARQSWSPIITMSLIGSASGALFALDRDWVYTSRITELANGNLVASPATLLGPVALIGGMVIAAKLGGMFRLRRGTARDWLTATGGGLLMGLGATLVPGGNDAMLFTGLPLLLPNLLAGYAAFIATLFVLLRVKAPRGGPTSQPIG
jgi:uncharacterized membrane protein YedE/YeeE